MKKFLAIVVLLTIFSGCSQNTQTGSSSSSYTKPPAVIYAEP